MKKIASKEFASNHWLAVSMGKNAMFGVFSQSVYMGSRFITVPFVIEHLGLGGYGIWAIILTVAGYMRFGAAGIKSAFIKYVAEATGTGDFEKASKLLSTGSSAMLVLSLLGVIPFALFSHHLARAAGVPPEFLSAAAISISILAFTYLVSNFGASYEAIVAGAQRIDLSRKFNTVLTLCETVAILAVLHLRYGLVALSIIIASSELLYIALCWAASLKVLPQVKVRLADCTRCVLPELIRFGGSYQLVNILEMCYLSIWPIVLLRLFGPEAAGISALALRIVSAVLIGQEAFSFPILSGAAMVFASGDSEQVRLFLAKSFKVTFLVTLLPLTFVAAFGAQIIHAWTGKSGPLFAGAVMLTALAWFFRGISGLELSLYRSLGKALLDNIRQVLRIVAALLVALLARKLGFFGVLAGISVAEVAGVIFMFYAMRASFREFSPRMLLSDAVRITLATAAIVGLGVIFGWAPVPLHSTERLGVVIRLGQVTLGCLVAAWPALRLTGAVSSGEWHTVLQAVLPGRRALAVGASPVQNLRDQDTARNQLQGRPLVSVVIPTFNRAKQTIEAIQSVLSQTYGYLEVIVVDDGSTDGTGDAVQGFVAQRKGGPIQIRYFRQPNQGPGAARNKGIEEAQGQYIAFLDSDDVWLPDKLEWQLRALGESETKCEACFTDVRCVNNDGMDVSTFHSLGRNYPETVGVEPNATVLIAEAFNGFWLSGLLARASVIRRIGGFDPAVCFAEDRDLYLRLSLVTSLAYVNKGLVRADRSPSPPGSNCRPWDKAEVMFRGQQRMYEKWLSMGTALQPRVRKIVLRDLRHLHSSLANWHLENGRHREACEAAAKAMSYGHTLRMTVKWGLVRVAPVLTRMLTGQPES